MPLLKSETIAAIDIGSNSLRMKIVDVKGSGKQLPLEDLRKTTNLGRDSFSQGVIRPDTVAATCNVLRDFSKLLKEYRIKNYRAVSTSAIREAENRDYVLDQIKVRTGLDIEVINNSQERFLTYKAIRDKLDSFSELKKEGMLIVDIGAGGVESSVYKSGSLVFTENIKVGALRLREMLYDLERKTLNFPDVMEQFIESKVYLLKALIKEKGIKNLIGMGGELKVISILCNHKLEGTVRISRQELDMLFAALRDMTTQGIVQRFNISTERAETLLPSLITLKKFFEVVESDYLSAPLVSLRDGIIADIIDERFKLKRRREFVEDILNSVKQLGRKYSFDEHHAERVEGLSISLFEGTKKLHGLGEKERFYLQVASLLHDIGKFISQNQHDKNSYNIIMQSSLIGLSDRDISIISNIARYHSDREPELSDGNYSVLSHDDRLMVSKLCAILKLSDSLDIGHKQSITKLEVELGEDAVVRIQSSSDAVLEQWAFENRAEFFQRVYGIKPILKKKGR